MAPVGACIHAWIYMNPCMTTVETHMTHPCPNWASFVYQQYPCMHSWHSHSGKVEGWHHTRGGGGTAESSPDHLGQCKRLSWSSGSTPLSASHSCFQSRRTGKCPYWALVRPQSVSYLQVSAMVAQEYDPREEWSHNLAATRLQRPRNTTRPACRTPFCTLTPCSTSHMISGGPVGHVRSHDRCFCGSHVRLFHVPVQPQVKDPRSAKSRAKPKQVRALCTASIV